MTIELAVFADDTMWRHFHRMYGSHADIELHKFIMAAVNNVCIFYNLLLFFLDRHPVLPEINSTQD